MIEIRLCSIGCARWISGLRGLPESSLVPRPPRDFGLMFGRSLSRRLQQIRTVDELLASSPDGLLFAAPSATLDSAAIAVSVVHAAAAAAVVGLGGTQTLAHNLEAFFEGREPHNLVPEPLSELAVISCVTRETAAAFGEWLRAVPRDTFNAEVLDMFGEAALAPYISVLEAVNRILESTDVHGADLCCRVTASVPKVTT